jgi:hypothetical protein
MDIENIKSRLASYAEKPKPSEIKPEQFIERNKFVYQSFGGDPTIKYVPNEQGFYFAHEPGQIGYNSSWIEQGRDGDLINWAIFHELSHFADLRSDPEGYISQFDGAKSKAIKLAPEIIQRAQGIIPNVSEKAVISHIESRINRFNNIANDIYVNRLVQNRSPKYEKGSKGEKKIENLYSSDLFKGTDYRKLPLHEQFGYYLLRKTMVPGEDIQVSPDIEQIMKTKIKFGKYELTPMEVAALLRPQKNKDTKASVRAKIVESTLEPIFIKLLMQDYNEKLDEKEQQKNQEQGSEEKQKNSQEQNDDNPKPPENKEKGEESSADESGDFDPFADSSLNPDSFEKEMTPEEIDKLKDQLKEYVKKQKEKEKKEDKNKEEDEKSPTEKAKEIQIEIDKKWCKDNNIEFIDFKKINKITQQIEPYMRQMTELWKSIIYGSSREIKIGIDGHFKNGTELDIQKVINDWPLIEQKKFDEIRPMLKTITKENLVEKPELIRIHLLGDISGSMMGEKKNMLDQAATLILRSFQEFNEYLEITREETKSKLKADSEIILFNDEVRRIKQFDSNDGVVSSRISTIKGLTNLISNGVSNGTDGYAALETVLNSLSPDDIEKIKSEKTMDMIFFITDGGMEAEDTRGLVDLLLDKGIICRAFQIGTCHEYETESFNAVWNTDREKKLGEIVGSDVANLIPLIKNSLQEYLTNVRL